MQSKKKSIAFFLVRKVKGLTDFINSDMGQSWLNKGKFFLIEVCRLNKDYNNSKSVLAECLLA